MQHDCVVFNGFIKNSNTGFISFELYFKPLFFNGKSVVENYAIEGQQA